MASNIKICDCPNCNGLGQKINTSFINGILLPIFSTCTVCSGSGKLKVKVTVKKL